MIQSTLLLWEKQSSLLKEKTPPWLEFPPPLSLTLRPVRDCFEELLDGSKHGLLYKTTN